MGRTLVLMCLALQLFSASAAAAKEGFYAGINMLFNDVNGDINTPVRVESGFGLGLHGGFVFNKYVAIESGIWRTKHANKSGGTAADLEAETLDLKLLVPTDGSYIEPFLRIGSGLHRIEQNGISANGRSNRIGIGIDVYLFHDIFFDVGITRSKVTFKQDSTDMDGSITTMDYGLSYHFN